jgi:uncharacterized BrkB/YihY/UPF0761 family membrane protein
LLYEFIYAKYICCFFRSNPFQNGAALAYYAVFSLLPMIIIINVVLGYFFGEKEVSERIGCQIRPNKLGVKVDVVEVE